MSEGALGNVLVDHLVHALVGLLRGAATAAAGPLRAVGALSLGHDRIRIKNFGNKNYRYGLELRAAGLLCYFFR